MKLDQIRQYWENAGANFSASAKVTSTSRDPFLAQLERDHILNQLQGDENVLEVGCGDASHTLHYAQRAKFVWALDVASSLIELAEQRAVTAAISNIKFLVGSILDVSQILAKEAIDCVISQRCLINLPGWEYQREALRRIYDLLVPNGLLLMTEGFQEELDSLNRLRERVGLSAIAVVSYNRNLLHREFDEFIRPYFTVEAVYDYGLYLLLSRVYHPLLVLPEQPSHDSRLNEVAAMLTASLGASGFKHFSYNLLYVLRKK